MHALSLPSESCLWLPPGLHDQLERTLSEQYVLERVGPIR